jgi:hypothetical protein
VSGTNVAKQAAVAQSVERRLGKAEVTGSIPVSSFIFLPILLAFWDFEDTRVVKIVIKTLVPIKKEGILCI